MEIEIIAAGVASYTALMLFMLGKIFEIDKTLSRIDGKVEMLIENRVGEIWHGKKTNNK